MNNKAEQLRRRVEFHRQNAAELQELADRIRFTRIVSNIVGVLTVAFLSVVGVIAYVGVAGYGN